MMRRFVPILAAVIAVGVLVALGSSGARGQWDPAPVPVPVIPPSCAPGRYDLNGDGKLDIRDLNRWKDLVLKGAAGCRLGAPSSACPPGLDMDDNGTIEFADLNRMIAHYRGCLFVPNDRPR